MSLDARIDAFCGSNVGDDVGREVVVEDGKVAGAATGAHPATGDLAGLRSSKGDRQAAVRTVPYSAGQQPDEVLDSPGFLEEPLDAHCGELFAAVLPAGAYDCHLGPVGFKVFNEQTDVTLAHVVVETDKPDSGVTFEQPQGCLVGFRRVADAAKRFTLAVEPVSDCRLMVDDEDTAFKRPTGAYGLGDLQQPPDDRMVSAIPALLVVKDHEEPPGLRQFL